MGWKSQEGIQNEGGITWADVSLCVGGGEGDGEGRRDKMSGRIFGQQPWTR